MNPSNLTGIFSMFKGLNLNKIVSGADKTISFVNKAIPLYKQSAPMLKNFRSFVDIYGAVKNTKNEEVKSSPKPRPIALTNKKNSQDERNHIVNDTLTFFQ